MICQTCGKRPATTHIKHTINGVTRELYVCKECASKQSYELFKDNTINISDLFGGLFTEPLLRETEQVVRCTTCSKSFREIVQSGRVGCSDCYVTFFDKLQPSIQRIHGKTTHVGKTALSAGNHVKAIRELDSLKAELAKAIAEQQYERCAQLRDRIKELEEGNHNG